MIIYRLERNIMIKSFIGWGQRISILTYLFLHIITTFWELPFLVHIHSLSGISMVVVSFFRLPLRKFKLPLFIVLTGIIILLTSDASYSKCVFFLSDYARYDSNAKCHRLINRYSTN